jgi:hypothetical protein
VSCFFTCESTSVCRARSNLNSVIKVYPDVESQSFFPVVYKNILAKEEGSFCRARDCMLFDSREDILLEPSGSFDTVVHRSQLAFFLEVRWLICCVCHNAVVESATAEITPRRQVATGGQWHEEVWCWDMCFRVDQRRGRFR